MRVPQGDATGCCCRSGNRLCWEIECKHANFALHAQGGMTNQRGALEACAAVLMARDCKLEVRLDNMWVKTGVEQMLSWIERKKQPTFRSERTLVWKAIWERLLQIPRDHVTLRHAPAHLEWSVRRGNRNSQQERLGGQHGSRRASEGGS